MGHSETFSFFNTGLQCWLVDLLVLGGIVSAFSVDVMGQQRMTVVDATDSGIGVSSTISMECWLTKISRERGVRQPSCGIKED